jgi:hypothetical protein
LSWLFDRIFLKKGESTPEEMAIEGIYRERQELLSVHRHVTQLPPIPRKTIQVILIAVEASGMMLSYTPFLAAGAYCYAMALYEKPSTGHDT